MNKFNLKYSRADGKREEAEGWDRKRTADGWQKDIKQKDKFDDLSFWRSFAIRLQTFAILLRSIWKERLFVILSIHRISVISMAFHN